MRQRYRRMEDQKPLPGLPTMPLKQDFIKGRRLKVQVGRRAEETSATQTHHRRGSGSENPTS